MRIRRLALRDFRGYADREIEFAPGLTVVRGPNEAGKTTIQRALELVLTRKVTSAAADLDGFRRWNATNDSRPELGDNVIQNMRRARFIESCPSRERVES